MKKFFAKRQNSANQQRGQGMTEYIIIVAMVAIAAIAVYQYFGQAVRGQTAQLALDLSGKQSDAGMKAAQGAADKAVNASKKTDLEDYANQKSKIN